MAKTAERTDPQLWEEVKAEVKQGSKGGQAGEWSASKAQLAVQEYKKRGGGYRGKKSGGKAGAGERLQAQDARPAHRSEEFHPKPEGKGERGGKSQQAARPSEAVPISAARHGAGKPPMAEPSKADLLRQAKMLEIEGRSRMTKEDLAKAIRYAKH